MCASAPHTRGWWGFGGDPYCPLSFLLPDRLEFIQMYSIEMQICAHPLLYFVILWVMSLFLRVLIMLKEVSVWEQINASYRNVLTIWKIRWDIRCDDISEMARQKEKRLHLSPTILLSSSSFAWNSRGETEYNSSYLWINGFTLASDECVPKFQLLHSWKSDLTFWLFLHLPLSLSL